MQIFLEGLYRLSRMITAVLKTAVIILYKSVQSTAVRFIIQETCCKD